MQSLNHVHFSGLSHKTDTFVMNNSTQVQQERELITFIQLDSD